MGDLGGDVDGVATLLEEVQVLGKRLPSPPRHADTERRAGDVLDPFHQVDQRIVISRAHRSESDPAVAHDKRGDSVGGGGLEGIVPGDLTVIVRVDVDPPRGHECAVRIDHLRGTRGHLADLHDPTVLDPHVGGDDGAPGSVNDPAALDDHIEHLPLLTVRPRGCGRTSVDKR